MTDWITGPRFKVKRAKEHLANLEASITLDPPPYGTFSEEKPDGGRVWRAKIMREPIPLLDWGCITSDVIHNLRSALDIMVHQFLLASGCKPSDTLQFPMLWESKQSFESAGVGEIERCSKQAMDIIKAAEPYQGGGPLWALATLDNSNKHKVLTPAAFVSVKLVFDVTESWLGAPPTGVQWHEWLMTLNEPIPTALLYDGAIVYEEPPDHPGKMNVKPKFTFAVAFGEGEVLKGEPLLPALHQMTDVVSGIVEAFANVPLGAPPRRKRH